MIHITAQVPPHILNHRDDFPLDVGNSLGFLDIETLGLSARRNPIILIGLMLLGPDSGIVHQLYAEHPEDEPDLLRGLQGLLPSHSLLLTYNGRSFDIPYINQRFEHWDQPFRIPKEQCVDLLHWSRQAFPKAPRHTLKTIEGYLGIHRKDTLSGADCVRLYLQGQVTGGEQAAREICGHNLEDILHLAPLLQLYAMLPAASSHRRLPFRLTVNHGVYWMTPSAPGHESVLLHGSCSMPQLHRVVCHLGSASLLMGGHSLELSLPVIRFDYPAPGSLFIDPDRIPGYMTKPFNSLSTDEKLSLMIFTQGAFIPESLNRWTQGLLACCDG